VVAVRVSSHPGGFRTACDDAASLLPAARPRHELVEIGRRPAGTGATVG
jgi:hypothetical protein